MGLPPTLTGNGRIYDTDMIARELNRFTSQQKVIHYKLRKSGLATSYGVLAPDKFIKLVDGEWVDAESDLSQ